MASDLVLRGVFVPLVTPFDASGAVAVDAIERLCTEVLDAGAAGIVALGTTGEAPALDAAEKKTVIDTCAKVCAPRSAPLIVGAGTNNTRLSVDAVKALAGVPGLSAVLTVVPYYVRPSDAGIIEHFKAVAAASPAPLVVYNIPYRTGKVLGSATLLELAALPNIAGVKQAVGAVDGDTLEVLAGAPDGFSLLAGDDLFIFPSVLLGATGGITASAHVCTERFVAMVECGLAGKVDEGRHHAEALLPVVRSLFVEPNPAVAKGVLHAQGRIPTPDMRLPMMAASKGSVDAALAAIDAAGRAR
jgi:4-hydroxy-tetrahydrodipicolinate synthase